MKKASKPTSLFLAVLIALAAVPLGTFTVSASIYSGQCGADVTWTVDTENEELIISGTGNMEDFNFSDAVPWKKYRYCIKTVSIKGRVSSIGAYAFGCSTELRNIQFFSNSLTNIRYRAFEDCNKLISLTLPASLTSFSAESFYRCKNLKTITVAKGNPVYHSKGNCVIETKSKQLVFGCNHSVIPDDGSVTSIGEDAFSDCAKMTSITIPDSISSIGAGAFWDCTGLTSITLPSSVTFIDRQAFAYCSGLTSINIPNSVTTIRYLAFEGCAALTGITLPSSITSIDTNTFDGCSRLTSITIPCSVTSIGNKAFFRCTKLTDVNFIGTPAQWNAIDIASYNNTLKNAKRHYYTPYSIAYELNGGKNSASNPKTYAAITPTFSLENPTRSGYTFKGWYSDKKLTKQVTKITKGTTGNKTLYAKWAKTYTITYLLNNGTNHKSNPKTYTNLDAVALKNPTRKGYAFKGWYADAKFKKKVTGIKKGTSGNKTLYAKWEKNTYKIAYQLNSGKNNSKNPKTYTVTSSVTLKNPTRKGYTFKGWYSDKKLTKKVTGIKKGTTGGKTFYAKWSKNTYKITYKLNSGKNNGKNPKTYTVTSSVALKKPTRKGYTFKGWYSDKKLTKKVTGIAKGTTGDKTLYAKWERTKYKITYELNGGKNNVKNPKTYTITDAVYLFEPTRNGYVFDGWCHGETFAPLRGIPKGSTGNIVLYANWKKS